MGVRYVPCALAFHFSLQGLGFLYFDGRVGAPTASCSMCYGLGRLLKTMRGITPRRRGVTALPTHPAAVHISLSDPLHDFQFMISDVFDSLLSPGPGRQGARPLQTSGGVHIQPYQSVATMLPVPYPLRGSPTSRGRAKRMFSKMLFRL